MKKILAALALTAALGSFATPAFAATPDHADKDHYKGGGVVTPPAQTLPVTPPLTPPVTPPASEPISQPVVSVPVSVPVSQPVNPPVTLPAVVPAAVAPRSLVTVQPPKEMHNRAILQAVAPAIPAVEPVTAITKAVAVAPAVPAPKVATAPATAAAAAASMAAPSWEVPVGIALVGVGVIALTGGWRISTARHPARHRNG